MLKNQKKYPCLVPFLKWAGGKRWLTRSYPNLFDLEFNRYIEPFIGSGAVYFHLQPSDAILADSNPALIDVYQAIRADWLKVKRELEVHHRKHSKRYYYIVREQSLKSPHKKAAQFIYLNRTCWNGLFRVNQNGSFNVPIGTKKAVVLDSDNFEAIAALLRGAELICSDFEDIIDRAGKGDLLFVDPPYTVKHDNNGFIKYNEKLFSWDDQERLGKAICRAKNRGAKIILTNANHYAIRKMYKENFQVKSIKRHSILSGQSEYRGAVKELIIVG
jgi:DNA adenine methylase